MDPTIHHPSVDSSRAPLYTWEVPRAPSDAYVIAAFEAREAWAAQYRGAVSWVVDLSHVTQFTAKQRRLMAEHMARFEPFDIRYNQGSGIVVPNALIRGFVTAVFWLHPPRFPHRFFANRGDASVWAEQQLAARSPTR